MHFGHSKVVFRPFYTFCTFYTNLPIRNDKMVNFQLKFHPTKQNVTKDIRPPMESSWSPLSKTAITFKFTKYLSMVLDCQRKSGILQKWKWKSTQQKRPPKNIIAISPIFFKLYLPTCIFRIFDVKIFYMIFYIYLFTLGEDAPWCHSWEQQEPEGWADRAGELCCNCQLSIIEAPLQCFHCKILI